MPASDWLDLCPQTIVWKSAASRDAYGKPSYAAPQTFSGRRVFENKRVSPRGPSMHGEGAEVVSSSTIWILGTPAVGYEDQVYVQGDDATKPPPILSITRYPDEAGDLFVKVYLGNANG